MRLAQEKVDQLMKQDFDTSASVAVGGSLTDDTENYFEEPLTGVTVRWAVAAGPVEDTRVLTVRVVNLRAQQYRETELTTIIREGEKCSRRIRPARFATPAASRWSSS